MSTASDRLLCQLATLGPIGHVRFAPGTLGSLVALVTGYIIASYSLGALVVAVLFMSILGVFAASSYQQNSGKKDAPEVIIDEVAGQWIPLVIIPFESNWYIAAFVLFRFFDISKIGPVGSVEQLPRGVGVMADDLVAGILTAIVLWISATGIENLS